MYTRKMMNKDKEHSALRKAMSKLDYAIPDYVFDSDEGSEISQRISDVWNEIDKIEIEISRKTNQNMYRFVVYKNCKKGWKIDEIFEDEDEAIQYVDEYKEEFKLDDTSIKYVHEECTEDEFKKYKEKDDE